MTLATKAGRTRPRVAFYGKVACDGNDATVIIARQYEHCLRALPPVTITAVYYDIGVGRAARRTPAPRWLPLPGSERRRDGGLADLVTEALSPAPRFNFVVASGPDRLSRDIRQASAILRGLYLAGVPCLFPASGDRAGSVTGLLVTAATHLLPTGVELRQEGECR